LDNANLSSGGDAVDVTESLHPAWKKLAANVAKDMNLRFTGIDVMLPGTLSEPPSNYRILEVNDSPGLDHYATIGPAQKKIVEDMYRKVLLSMAR
jgi:D-alanine-D-alanine ligase-like ATP-grasp enzyme